MSLRDRFEKLEPRERRLLSIFGGILGVGLFLVIPVAIVSYVSNKRSENEDLSALLDTIYDAKAQVAERRAKHDALVGRYAKPAPPLAGYLDELAKAENISAAESQDRPEAFHGKRYGERITVMKMHKVSLLPLVKMLEKIEQSGYPIVISKLMLKPRLGEPDQYEVELGVSAFDRKSDTPGAAPAGSGSAGAAGSAAPAAGTATPVGKVTDSPAPARDEEEEQ